MAAADGVGGGVITVRLAGLRDMGVICLLEARCFGVARLFGGQWQRLGTPMVRAWTAHVDAVTAGFLIAYPHRFDDVEKPYVAALGVSPARRRCGAARALLRAALATYGEAWLHVRTSNAPAIALYEAMGFAAVRRLGAYYRDGEDACVMRTW